MPVDLLSSRDPAAPHNSRSRKNSTTGLRRVFEDTHRPLTDSAWGFAVLPLREGGLGLTRASSIHAACYIGSIMATMRLTNRLIYPLALPVTSLLDSALENISAGCSLGPNTDVQHLLARAANSPSGTLPDLQNELTAAIFEHQRRTLVPPLSDRSPESVRVRIRMHSVSSPSATLPFTTPPQSHAGTRVDPEIWITMVDVRIGNPLFSGATSCPFCNMSEKTANTPLDLHGQHASTCSRAEGTTSRHNDLRDWLFRSLKTLVPHLHIEREKTLMQDEHLPRTSQRKYDLFISDLSVSPRPQAYDLTIISPHSEPYVRNAGRNPTWAVQSAERKKIRKYGPSSTEKQIEFHPLAMDLYGCIGPTFDPGLHSVISLIAQRRGTSPITERSNLLTKMMSRALQLTAVAINRRRLDLMSPS